MRVKLLLSTILFSLAAVSIVSAWTGPTASAPNNNVSAPINVGGTAQVKNGDMSVNNFVSFGNVWVYGSGQYLNFGTTGSGSGGYGIRDNGGTLEFKNSGGSWASMQSTVNTLVGGGSQWTTSGSNIYYNTGNVGVGASPTSKLTVAGGSISGNYGLLPNYAGWATYGTGDGGAAIYNDSGSYKTLMIVGNTSAGGSRSVSVWDMLTVNGQMNAASYCIAGANCITAWPSTSATIGGSGTSGYVPRYTAGTTLGNSSLTSDGSSATANGNFFVTNTAYVQNGLDVSNASGAYTYITMHDDESPNGVKYIHANSNLIGFLSGQGSWIARWDNSGNEWVGGAGNYGGSVTASSYCIGSSCISSWPSAYSNTDTLDTVTGRGNSTGNAIVAGDFYTNGWFRVNGNAGIYWQNWGSGFNMTDSSWIRSYGPAGLWMNAAPIGTNGYITVGYGGGGAPASGAAFAGSVGIGTQSPDQKLTVVGTIHSTSGGIEFPDGTTQTTAAVAAAAAKQTTATAIRQYASSGTWSKPANLAYIIVEVYGGGGGGGGNGNAPGSGGTSSFGAFASASGGAAGSSSMTGGAGGSGSSGDVNESGQVGSSAISTVTMNGCDSGCTTYMPGRGGVAAGGGLGNGGDAGGANVGTAASGGGGGGGYSRKLIQAASLPSSVSVTVGAAGAASAYQGIQYSEAGGPGSVIVTEYTTQ